MKSLPKILTAALCASAAAGGAMYARPADQDGGGTFGAMLGQAENMKGEIDADYGRAVEMRQVARKDKDIIKLTCINDKLVMLKPQMNIADQALLQLRAAVDAGGAKSAFDAVTQAHNAIHDIRGDAEGCAGQKLLETEASNSFTHPDIPDSPDMNPWGNRWELEPPAYASPVN